MNLSGTTPTGSFSWRSSRATESGFPASSVGITCRWFSGFHQHPRRQLLCNTQQALQAPGGNLPVVSPSTPRWVLASQPQLAASQPTFPPSSRPLLHPPQRAPDLSGGPFSRLVPSSVSASAPAVGLLPLLLRVSLEFSYPLVVSPLLG